MKTIKRSAIVPYNPEQLFSLVNNIESYPDFIKGCVQTIIKSRTVDSVNASLIFKKAGMLYSFTTHNQLFPPARIEMKLLEGPFKNLTGFWQFESIGQAGCKIIFNIEYEFNNGLIALAFNAKASKLADELVNAFCKRAKNIYG